MITSFAKGELHLIPPFVKGGQGGFPLVPMLPRWNEETVNLCSYKKRRQVFHVFSKIWLINISLAVFVIFFGIKGLEVWRGGDGTIPETRTGKNSRKPLPAKRIVGRVMPPESVYGIVADKNLFFPDRAEFIPDESGPETKAPQAKVSGKKILLYGVVLMDDYRKALIGNPRPEAGERRSKWVKAGDRMGDFSVTEIKKDSIILTEGARKYEIFLYDKDKPKRRAKAAGRSRPTVVTTKPAATAAKSKRRPPMPGISKKKNSSEGEYKIIDTPFGKIRRKVK